MSLPSALTVDVKEINDFRKTLISFHPEEISREYKSGEIIHLKFPKGLLDLSTFNLFFNARTTFKKLVEDGGVYYAREYLFPKNTSSLIQRLRVFIDNQEITNITDYNLLYSLLYNIQNEDKNNVSENENVEFKIFSNDGYNFNRVLNVARNSTDANIMNAGWFEYANQPTQAKTNVFSISDWIGFFQSVKYINTFNIDLSIEIELASPYVLFIPDIAGTTRNGANLISELNPEFYLWNLKANVHKIDFAMAPNILNNELTFMDYTSKNGNRLTDNKTQKITINVKTKCINKLIGTFIYNDYNTVTDILQSGLTPQGIDYERFVYNSLSSKLGNSRYFKQIGKGLETTSFYIDNIPINNNPMTMIEIEKEVKHCFNIEKTRWRTLEDFTNDFFSASLSLEDNIKNVDGDIIKSGYDTNKKYSSITWETQGKTVPANTATRNEFLGIPLLFVEMTRTIRLENNNLIII